MSRLKAIQPIIPITPSTIKIFKRPADKGLVVAWDNGNGKKQPQITLDYDEAPVAKVMEMTINTNVKKVEEQKPEVTVPEVTVPQETVPNNQPNCSEIPKEEIVEKVEVKENTLEETKTELMDDLPDTADTSNFTLVYQLLAASGITMVWLGTTAVVKRRKNRI